MGVHVARSVALRRAARSAGSLGDGQCVAAVRPVPVPVPAGIGFQSKDYRSVKEKGPESRRGPVQRWRMRTRNHCVVPCSVAVQKQKRPTEWLGVVCGGLGLVRKIVRNPRQHLLFPILPVLRVHPQVHQTELNEFMESNHGLVAHYGTS